MSATVSADGAVSVVALMLAPGWVSVLGCSLRGRVAGVQRGRPRGRGAGRRPRAWQQRPGRRDAPSASRIVTRLVSVPKPGAGLGDVVGDEQVDALAARACPRRGRASRSPRRTRRGPARAQRPPGRAPVRVEAADDPGDLGEEVRRRLRARGSAPSPRSSLRRGGVGRPEVGDRGGHDQRIEAGRSASVVGQPAGAPRAGRRWTRPGRPSASPSASGDLDACRR